MRLPDEVNAKIESLAKVKEEMAPKVAELKDINGRIMALNEQLPPSMKVP